MLSDAVLDIAEEMSASKVPEMLAFAIQLERAVRAAEQPVQSQPPQPQQPHPTTLVEHARREFSANRHRSIFDEEVHTTQVEIVGGEQRRGELGEGQFTLRSVPSHLLVPDGIVELESGRYRVHRSNAKTKLIHQPEDE